MTRRYKDPDLAKIKVAIDMTPVQRETFKRACKLAGMKQGDFVYHAAKEYIRNIAMGTAEGGL